LEYLEYLSLGSGISYANTWTLECPTSINFTIYYPDFNQTIMLPKELEYKEIAWAKKKFESKIMAYEKKSGWIFWNFKIESKNYQWDFLKYLELTKANFGNYNDYKKNINMEIMGSSEFDFYYGNKVIGTIVICFGFGIIFSKIKYANKIKNTDKFHKGLFVGNTYPDEKILLMKKFY
jgi:hypothetical protein